MKTNVLTTALLAFSIQVMVNGQTPDNQSRRILPTLGEKNSVQKPKPLPELISTVENENLAKQLTGRNVLFSYSKNLPLSFFTKEYADKLLIEAEALMEEEQILRISCKKSEEKQKQKFCETAQELLKQAQNNQLVASEIKGKINLDQFSLNLNQINSLLAKVESSSNVYENSTLQKQLSFHLMKLAKEMREEAYSLENTSAKIGTLANAEEKESASLDLQFSTIVALKKAIAFYISFNDNILACR